MNSHPLQLFERATCAPEEILTNLRVNVKRFPGGYSGFPSAFRRQSAPGGQTDAKGGIQVTPADIHRAAATYGASPLQVIYSSSAGQAQPMPLTFSQLTWRSHLVSSNLSVGPASILRSHAYDRLDPSEKSAVSYFLGMTQASLVIEKVLGIAFTAHLDLVMAALNIPLARRSRPDLLGVDPSGTLSASIEAKGRSGGFSSKVVSDAKIQAQKLPVVQGVPLSLSLASLAYFDRSRVWLSHLEDPPATGSSLAVPKSLLIAAHYARLVDLAHDPKAQRYEGDFNRIKFSSEDDAIEVEIPIPVLAAFENSEYRPGRLELLPALGDQLAPIVARLSAEFQAASSTSTSMGFDGVLFRFRNLATRVQ